MSRHSSSNRRGRHNKSAHRRRNRAIGTGSAIGAFLAFGMAPPASAPQARADEIELILDPIISALSGIDPTLGADLGTFGADLSSLVDSIDPSLAGDSTAALGSLSDPVAAATTASSSTSPDISQLIDTYLWTPINTGLQDWITSPFGEQVDTSLNQLAGVDLIGNGAAGTMTDPNGGDAGLWCLLAVSSGQ